MLGALLILSSGTPAHCGGFDPLSRASERTLRAAELCTDPVVARTLYAHAANQAERVLALDEASAGAHFVYFASRGRLLMEEGLARNLLELRALDRDHLARALQLNPDLPEALAARGGILLDLPALLGGDPEAAVPVLRRARNLNPGGAGTRVALARALLRTGRREEALREARAAAHRSCMQGRRKTLEESLAVLAALTTDKGALADGGHRP